jgi:tRNA-dihydrouridine synthase B
MRIGHITLANRLFAAPMAGVTDRPFRKLCKRLGAGLRGQRDGHLAQGPVVHAEDRAGVPTTTVSGADLACRSPAPTRHDGRGRRPTTSSAAPRSSTSTWAAPAKKVCNQWARLALMRNEAAGARAIVDAVGRACPAAWRAGDAEDAQRLVRQREDAVRIAPRAEGAGIAHGGRCHGRTREQGYRGDGRDDTVAAVKRARSAIRCAQTATSTRRPRRARSSRAPAPTPS